MANASARRAMVRQATFQVRNGGAFVRRATKAAKPASSQKATKQKSGESSTDKTS